MLVALFVECHNTSVFKPPRVALDRPSSSIALHQSVSFDQALGFGLVLGSGLLLGF